MMNNNCEFNNCTLIFDFKFNQDIKQEIIDKCIEQKIKKIIFNNYNDTNLMYLYSNNYFEDIDGESSSWRANRFNKSISELAKIDLEHLVLGAKFNKKVSNLPNSLETLILGMEFSQPLDNLPNNLKRLCCKNCIKFSYDLDYLPESLEHIIISPNFNKTLDNLPQNIRILDVYNISYTNYLDNNLTILPSKLESIILNLEYHDTFLLVLMTRKISDKIHIIHDKSYNIFSIFLSN